MIVLRKLWRSLVEFPTRRAVRSEWRERLGAEFDPVADVFRPLDVWATSWPGESGLRHEVIRHGPNDWVTVCPDSGQRRPISRDDLRILELDIPTILTRLRTAIAITTPVTSALPSHGRCHPLGTDLQSKRPVLFVWATNRFEWSDLAEWLRDQRVPASSMLIPQVDRIPASLLTAWRRAGHEPDSLEGRVGVDVDGVWRLMSGREHRSKSPELVTLTTNQRDALSVLSSLRADSSDRRRSIEDIAFRVTNKRLSGDTFKAVLRDLKSRGFVASKTGRDGGYWLTPAGIRRSEAI